MPPDARPPVQITRTASAGTLRGSVSGNAAVQDAGNQMARSNATHHRPEHTLRRQRVEPADRISDDELPDARCAAMRQVTSAPLDGPTGVGLRKLSATNPGEAEIRPPRHVSTGTVPAAPWRSRPAFGIPTSSGASSTAEQNPAAQPYRAISRHERPPQAIPSRRVTSRPPGRVDDDPDRERSGAGQHANLVLLRQLHPIDRAGLARLHALLMRIIEQSGRTCP